MLHQFLVYHSPLFPQTAGYPRQIHANESYQTFDIVPDNEPFPPLPYKKEGFGTQGDVCRILAHKGVHLLSFKEFTAHAYIVMRVYIRIQTFVVLKDRWTTFTAFFRSA